MAQGNKHFRNGQLSFTKTVNFHTGDCIGSTYFQGFPRGPTGSLDNHGIASNRAPAATTRSEYGSLPLERVRSNWDRVVRPDSGRKTFLNSPDSHKFLLAPVRFLLRARRSWDHARRILNRCARILEGYKSNWRINVDSEQILTLVSITRESFGFWWLHVKLMKDMDKKIF